MKLSNSLVLSYPCPLPFFPLVLVHTWHQNIYAWFWFARTWHDNICTWFWSTVREASNCGSIIGVVKPTCTRRLAVNVCKSKPFLYVIHGWLYGCEENGMFLCGPNVLVWPFQMWRNAKRETSAILNLYTSHFILLKMHFHFYSKIYFIRIYQRLHKVNLANLNPTILDVVVRHFTIIHYV